MKQLTRRQFMIAAAGATLAACAPKLAAPTSRPSASATGVPAADAAIPPSEILVTPADKLYIQTFGGPANVDAADWSLTIDGMVAQPLKLTYSDILGLPKVVEMRTLQCIGNPLGGPLVGNVNWSGAFLNNILKEAQVQPGARRARFNAADGYFTGVTLDWIAQDGTLLAYEIDGEPLTPEHGFPMRILMPGLYGQKMPKWITRIEFTDADDLGFWEQQGWSNIASVQTNSKFEYPVDGTSLNAGSVPLYGIAYAGKRDIVKVEVRIDDGEWQAAKLLHGTTPLVWTQWSVDWKATSGVHALFVRATDSEGFTQADAGSGVIGNAYPNGTSAIHSVRVRVA
jgi:DMSO/TMAO reductase YedYZ molybdopterin-dependent catalytic subunit